MLKEDVLKDVDKEENSAPFPIEALPIEILFNVLNHLPLNDLLKLVIVNKYFLNISSQSTFWRNKVRSHFPHVHDRFLKHDPISNWRKTYLDAAISEYQKYPDKTIWDIFNCAKDGKIELLKLHSQTYKLETLIDTNSYNLLHWAAHNGHIETVKFLLKLPMKVNDKNKNNFNAIELALHNGHVDLVNYLLEEGGTINFSSEKNLKIPLHKGHLDAVRYLLDNNVIDFKEFSPVNLFLTLQTVDNYILTRLFFDRWSPFHNTIAEYDSLLRMAMRNEQCDLAYILMKLMKIDILQQHFLIPVKEILTAAANNDKIDLVEFIHNSFPNVLDLNWLLSIAASEGSNDVVKFLIAKGANCNSFERRFHPLANACENNHIEVVELLLDNHAAIDAYNQSSSTSEVTAFILAVQNKHLEVAQFLIGRGCNVNLPDSNGKSPLAYAVGYDANLEVIELLLNNYADVNTCDENGDTPLHVAASFRQPEAIDMLLKKGAKAVPNNEGETPFLCLIKTAVDASHRASFNSGPYIQTFQALLKFGAQIEMDPGLNTPLHILCMETGNGLIPLIDFFIDLGVDINSANKLGVTALHYAANQNLVIFEHLLRRGADIRAVDKNGDTVLHYACSMCNDKLVNLILSQAFDINVKNYCGATPLHYAAEFTSLETIQALIEKGADIKLLTKAGDSILHFAVKRTSFYSKPMIEWILEKGYDINQANGEGVTPLHVASKESNLAIIKFLIKKGANKDAIDHDGNTVLHFVLQNNAYDVSKTLTYSLKNFHLDINAQNNQGATALHHLANGRPAPEKWDVLISWGAKSSIRDNHNKTPIDYLLENYRKAKQNSIDDSSLSALVCELIKIHLYKSQDFDLNSIEKILSQDKWLLSQVKELIMNAGNSHKLFQEATKLFEKPLANFSLPDFLSPIQKGAEQFLVSRLNQLLEMSKKADKKYFEKCLYMYLTHDNKLQGKFLRHLLMSPAVLTSDHPKTLLILAGYAKEKRFLSLANEDIQALFFKAAKLCEAEGEMELATFANEQTKEINRLSNLSI